MRLTALAVLLFARVPSGSASSDDPVGILFIREKGIGTAAHLQAPLDRWGNLLAARMQWSGVKSPYLTTRTDAPQFIKEARPRYAVLSLAAFLSIRQELHLEVLGRMEFAGSGQHYYVVSKSLQTLEACKGRTLTSLHADDVRFIDTVVFGRAAKLSDFTLVPATRPSQAIKKLVHNEAECALIDEPALADLPRMDGADGIRSIWKSAPLPLLVIAAFPSAPAEERSRFRDLLPRLAEGDGEQICKDLGIQAVQPASDKDLDALIQDYEKK